MLVESPEIFEWLFINAAWLPWWLKNDGRGHLGLILGLGRSPGEGNGNSFQYSCLRNPTDRRAWQVTVRGVAKVLDNLVTIQQRLVGRASFSPQDGSTWAGNQDKAGWEEARTTPLGRGPPLQSYGMKQKLPKRSRSHLGDQGTERLGMTGKRYVHGGGCWDLDHEVGGWGRETPRALISQARENLRFLGF